MILLCFLVLTTSTTYADYLPLPKSLHNKSIYYVKSRQLDNWSCGYNVLFNAINLENYLGRTNSYSDYTNFNALCSSHVHANGLRPKDGTTFIFLQPLAQRLLLEKFCCLTIDEHSVVPYYPGRVHISWHGKISQAQKDMLFKQEKAKQRQKILDDLISYLTSNKAPVQCLHFVCDIMTSGGGHWILVSLVQYNKSRALYIFDNMNGLIDEACSVKKYIDYIYNLFTLEKYTWEREILFPARWPSLNRS